MLIRVLRTSAVAFGWAVVGFTWLWCLGAVWRHPWWPESVGLVLALAFVAGSVAAVVRWPWRSARTAVAVACGVIVLLAILPQPSHEGEWARQQARMATVDFDGDRVTIHGLRRTTYDGDEVVAVEWADGTYDLSELESVWFGVQQLSGWKSLAHTFVSFGFSDGRYLAVSIESRRREGESFSPLSGTYRNYGLVYVLGDEREIIGARALFGEDDVFLYPVRATPEAARAMLVDVLRRANDLAERPEFYDTWENNCTNNLVVHLNRVAPLHVRPWSWRVAFPGHTGQVAYDHGLLDDSEPFETIRARSLVNDRARDAQHVTDPNAFSAAIRPARR